MCSKQTFRGFVNMCSKKYQRYKSSNPPFMDLNTFISCLLLGHQECELIFLCHAKGAMVHQKFLLATVPRLELGLGIALLLQLKHQQNMPQLVVIADDLIAAFYHVKQRIQKQKDYTLILYLRFICDCILQRKCELLTSEDNVLSLNSLISYLPSESISAFHTFFGSTGLRSSIPTAII